MQHRSRSRREWVDAYQPNGAHRRNDCLMDVVPGWVWSVQRRSAMSISG